MRTRICQEEFVYELVLKQTSKDTNNHVNRDRGLGEGGLWKLKNNIQEDKPAQTNHLHNT